MNLDLNSKHVLPLLTQSSFPIKSNTVLLAGAVYAMQTTLLPYCPYNDIQQKMSEISTLHANMLIQSLARELPALIGLEVDQRMVTRLNNHKVEITNEIVGAKEALLAKTSSSIVTLNGSILGFGKITDAYTKTIELLQGVGKAWRGEMEEPPASNVDNIGFLSQLGRAALNGAKGAAKLTAGSLGAAVVMSAMLATAGIALEKTHNAFPSVPAASSIVSSITKHAEKIKVSVGAVEIERVASPEVNTLTIQDRATALLAQNGNDYSQTIKGVETALGLSYMNEGKVDAIRVQKELLTKLQEMQENQGKAPIVSASSTNPTFASGFSM